MRPDTYSARAPDRAHWPWLLVALITIYTAVLLSSLFSSEALLRDAIDRRLLADGTHSAAQVADFLAERQRDVMASAESRAINDYLVNRALGMSERYGLNLSLDDIDRHLAGEIRNTRLRSNAELEQLTMVFTHAREGVSVTDVNGTILKVNDAFCRLSGYEREELIGQNPRILSSGRQSAECYAQMHALADRLLEWKSAGRQAEVLAALAEFRALDMQLLAMLDQFAHSRHGH